MGPDGFQLGAIFLTLTRLLLRCMMKMPQAGWVIAARHYAESRKVRTPQGAAPGKPRDGAICRIGPQKQVAAAYPSGYERSK